MYYTIYVVALIFYFVWSIGGGRSIENYIDDTTVLFILIPCVLILFSTKKLKAFGRGILMAFGRQEQSPDKCKETRQAIKMTLVTIIVQGGLGFLIGIINSIRGSGQALILDGEYGRFFMDLSVALLAPFYALLICVLLFPVYFAAKIPDSGKWL